MLFGKKSKQENENLTLLQKLHGREIKYATVRNSQDYSECIIGKDGVINVVDSEILIVCQNRIVFRRPLSEVEGGELMSLEGINLKYKDSETGDYVTVVAYYKYYRK